MSKLKVILPIAAVAVIAALFVMPNQALAVSTLSHDIWQVIQELQENVQELFDLVGDLSEKVDTLWEWSDRVDERLDTLEERVSELEHLEDKK